MKSNFIGTFFLLIMFPCLVIAQDNMKVVSFQKLEYDLTANTHGTRRLDQNGETAALIKIATPERGFTFDGGSLGIVATEERNGEIWLYVPRRAQKLIVQHKDYGVMRDFVYPIPIEGGCTYEMYIDIGIGRYVTITSQIANSTIYIDGDNCGQGPINNRYLSYGRHHVRALKDRYEGEQDFMITTNDDNRIRLITIEQHDMSDHFGDVTLKVDNKADIYFEGKRVGNSEWHTQLREGNYTIETRKADCEPAKTTFSIVAKQNNVIKVNAPTPHTGWLSIYTRPGNVKTTYNGNHFIDLSETVSVPIGTYQMEFSRRGFETQNHEYVVRHNQATVDTVTLSRINYIKPIGYYFGIAFTVRNLSGLTAIIGGTYQKHDLQASYTLGLAKTKRTYWSDKNGNYLGSANHQLNSFSIKYGYQIQLINQLALTPQMGYTINSISTTLKDGSTKFADGATANCLAIGAKLIYAPIKHFYGYLAPEFDFVLSKDSAYEAAMKKAGFDISGFLLNIGAMINF